MPFFGAFFEPFLGPKTCRCLVVVVVLVFGCCRRVVVVFWFCCCFVVVVWLFWLFLVIRNNMNTALITNLNGKMNVYVASTIVDPHLISDTMRRPLVICWVIKKGSMPRRTPWACPYPNLLGVTTQIPNHM